MPTTNVNTFDTIEEWRLKTNELGVKIADLDNNLFTINVIASGNITASGNINALGNVVVTRDAVVSGNVLVSRDTVVSGNIVGASNAIITGNVLAANVNANVHYGTWITSKPAINVLFNANITGSANLLLSNSGTNIITISANVANDSVTLGTHTIGNYVKEITSADTSNIIVNNGVGEGTTPTVNLAMTNVTPGVYGNANFVGSFTVTRDGRLTNASNLQIDRAYILTTGKPSVNLNFTGDVTGKANVNLSAENTNTLDVALTIQPDSVALGTDTTGNYVQAISSADTSNIIVNNGTGESSNPTVNLAMTNVTPGSYGNANNVSSFNVTRDGRLVAASNVAIDRAYILTTGKPSINLSFTGDVTGSGSVNLSNENTNSLSIGLTVQPNSVALGTDTTGNYVENLVQGSGITLTGATPAEGGTPTISANVRSVGTFVGDVSNANLLSSLLQVDGAGSGLDADVLDGQNGTYYLDWANQTNKPAINLTFTGDVTGTGGVVLTNSGTNSLSIALTNAGNSIELGVDTTGDYVANLTQGTGISISGGSGERSTPTIGLATVSGVAGSYGTANAVSQITVDSTGRISSASNVTIDRRYATVTEKPSINLRFVGDATGSGNLTISSSDKNELAITMSVSGVSANTLPTTPVTPGTYGGTNRVPYFIVDNTGRLTDAGNAQLVYSSVANKPSVNLTFTGDVTGSGSINLANENTNSLSIGLTIAADSIALGTDTTGNYTDRVVGGTGLTATGTANEGNVITVGLTNTGVAATTYGNATVVPVITVDAQGRITSASNVTISGVGATSSNVFSYFGAGANTISFTRSTHSAINSSQFNFFAGACAGNAITTGVYNVIFGSCAGRDITSGRHNFIAGLEAGRNNTTGSCNNFFGQRAGFCNTTGGHNTFIGDNAGFFSTFGCHNIGIGATSLNQITNGSQNISLGDSSGWVITSGNRNINLGQFAGGNITTGNDNIIVGCLTTNVGLTTNTSNVIIMATGGIRRVRFVSACHNLSVGTCSGNALTSGINNTLLGLSAGFRLTSGSNNNFFGANAGCATTTGCYNNFFGPFAGLVNSAGSGNNFFGDSSGFTNNTGSNNNFFGKYTGYNNTIGCDNVFLGTCSGFLNNSGNRNIYLGQCAGGNVETGNDNIIIGRLTSCVGLTTNTSNVIIMATGGIQRFCHNAVLGNTTIAGNIITSCNLFATKYFGDGSSLTGVSTTPDYYLSASCTFESPITNTQTSSLSVMIGRVGANRNSSGSNNVFIGNQAGLCNTSGFENTFLGAGAGSQSTTGSRNIYIGSSAGSNSNAGLYNVAIGLSAGNAIKANDNVFVGSSAGFNTTTGCQNVFIGRSAGYFNTCGNFNIFLGANAGQKNEQQCQGIAIGFNAGFENRYGTCNIFFGSYSGCNTGTISSALAGHCNIFFGHCAGICHTNGNRNLFLGHLSGANVTTGNDNIIFGCLTSCVGLTNNTSNVIILATGGCQKVKIDSRNNFFVGQLAGICAATSCHNVGVGSYTMSSPTYGIVSGCYNTAFGRFSLRNLTSGNHNVAIGNQSLVNLQNGNDNVAIGPSTLTNNFSAWRNIAIGSGAIGGGCITGYDNIAMGCSAGQCLTSAECNNFIGRGAGYYTTTGSNNNFFGSQAGFKNVGGTFNTFIGYQAGYCSTTGNYNYFLGSQAGFFNTSGIHNNFFGTNAGYCNTSGNYNNVMGRWAGFRNTTGCNNVFIGHLAGCCNTTGSNNLFFGCMSGVTLGCTSTESNRIVMGNPNHCLACIQIAWTTPSDIRDKCIFGPVPHGKSFLGKINPITFSFKNRETNELKETKKRYGFSAQEVLEAEGSDPVIVGTDNPEKLGFTTDFIIPILVNAVKELTKDVEDLRAEIAELKKSR